jgi:hypothetical protein
MRNNQMKVTSRCSPEGVCTRVDAIFVSEEPHGYVSTSASSRMPLQLASPFLESASVAMVAPVR